MKAVCISIGANYGHAMDDAARSLRGEGYDVEVVGADSCDMDSDILFNERMLSEVRSSDVVFVRVHGDVTYFKKFATFENTVESCGVCTYLMCDSEVRVTDEHRHLFTGNDEDFDLLTRFMASGGDVNNRSALMWALKKFDGVDLEIPEPVILPAQGAYTLEERLLDIGDAVASMKGDRPRICVFFHQRFWVAGNCGGVDGLLRALRERGADAIGVFTMTYPDDAVNAIGIG